MPHGPSGENGDMLSLNACVTIKIRSENVSFQLRIAYPMCRMHFPVQKLNAIWLEHKFSLENPRPFYGSDAYISHKCFLLA